MVIERLVVLSRFSQTGLVCDRFSGLALTRFVGLGIVIEFLRVTSNPYF